jgi:hypothetical protein
MGFDRPRRHTGARSGVMEPERGPKSEREFCGLLSAILRIPAADLQAKNDVKRLFTG